MTHTVKHTPGPWTADGANLLYAAPSEEDQFEVIEVNAPYNTQDRLLIASIPAGFADSAANAVLIAAAPAMYAVIKDMREAFYVKGTRKALLEVMERSKDVLAQAEGRHHE